VRAPRRLTHLAVGDGPEAWRAAGFRVRLAPGDGTDGQASLVAGGVRIQLIGDQGARGLLGWGLEPAWSAPIDGLLATAPPTAGTAAGGADGAPRHPNGVAALDHVLVTSPDVERTTTALAAVGIQPRRTVRGVRGDDDVLYRFFLLGTCVLELVGPATPAGDAPACFAGLAFTTSAIDDLGELTGPPRPAIQPGRRIATVRPESGLSVPIAFLTPRP
jgi:hypothetical protein